MNKYCIYCDESGIGKHRYMVIGGVIINSNRHKIINETIQKFRQETNMNSELKFTKITSQKAEQYNIFIDYVFSLINNDHLHYKAIVIDTHDFDRAINRELTFQKLYYQLCRYCFMQEIPRKSQVYFYLDRRVSSYKIADFHTILNNTAKKHYEQNIVSAEYRDSKLENLVQIADLLTGSLTFFTNQKHLISGTRQAKIDTVNSIIGKANIKLYESTTRNIKRFKVWYWKPKSKVS
jgi:hypothetical protein